MSSAFELLPAGPTPTFPTAACICEPVALGKHVTLASALLKIDGQRNGLAVALHYPNHFALAVSERDWQRIGHDNAESQWVSFWVGGNGFTEQLRVTYVASEFVLDAERLDEPRLVNKLFGDRSPNATPLVSHSHAQPLAVAESDANCDAGRHADADALDPAPRRV